MTDRELTEARKEDLIHLSAMCKRIAVLGGPMTLDVSLDRELRSRIQVCVDEAKHMRNYLRSHEFVGDDDRWRPRTVPPCRPAST